VPERRRGEQHHRERAADPGAGDGRAGEQEDRRARLDREHGDRDADDERGRSEGDHAVRVARGATTEMIIDACR
jgi:hypothetical protein